MTIIDKIHATIQEEIKVIILNNKRQIKRKGKKLFRNNSTQLKHAITP